MNEEYARKNGHSNIVADAYGPEYVPEEFDLDRLRQQAIAAGHDISQVGHQRTVAERRARAALLAQEGTRREMPEWFNAIERLVVATGNALVLVLMLLLNYVAPPVAIVGLAIAEYRRVAEGVALFDAPRAELMSTVAVAAYLVLLVIRAGYVRNEPTRERAMFSLRLVWRRFRYVLGLGRGWQPEQRGGVARLEAAINRLGWLVITLGTAGSMQVKFTEMDGRWFEALYAIMFDSTLIDFFAFMGGFLLTAALLAAMHFTVEHTYAAYVRIVPESALDFFDAGGAQTAADRAEALYLMSLINQPKSAQKR